MAPSPPLLSSSGCARIEPIGSTPTICKYKQGQHLHYYTVGIEMGGGGGGGGGLPNFIGIYKYLILNPALNPILLVHGAPLFPPPPPLPLPFIYLCQRFKRLCWFKKIGAPTIKKNIFCYSTFRMSPLRGLKSCSSKT